MLLNSQTTSNVCLSTYQQNLTKPVKTVCNYLPSIPPYIKSVSELATVFCNIRTISLSRRLRPCILRALSMCRCFRPFKLGLSVCVVLSASYIMPFMAAKSVPDLSASYIMPFMAAKSVPELSALFLML